LFTLLTQRIKARYCAKKQSKITRKLNNTAYTLFPVTTSQIEPENTADKALKDGVAVWVAIGMHHMDRN
jgi:hypothetical protein